jgi:hypothetical protein
MVDAPEQDATASSAQTHSGNNEYLISKKPLYLPRILQRIPHQHLTIKQIDAGPTNKTRQL